MPIQMEFHSDWVRVFPAVIGGGGLCIQSKPTYIKPTGALLVNYIAPTTYACVHLVAFDDVVFDFVS